MCTKIFRINSSPDTLRPHPDTPRHNSDTPRHRHFYTIQGTGRKSNIRVSWLNIFFCQQIWYWCLPRHHQTPSRHHPDTLRHHPDIIQTPSDTIQTLPNIDVFMQQTVLEERAISEYGLFQILPIDLVLLHPEISSVLRHIPDTKQTPQTQPRYPQL